MSKTDRKREDDYERRRLKDSQQAIRFVVAFILCVLAARAIASLFNP
jgi:hypothetical protein